MPSSDGSDDSGSDYEDSFRRAGPSKRPTAVRPTASHRHNESLGSSRTQNGHGHGPRRSLRDGEGLEGIFEKQDRETKARLGREYREMQLEAEDMKANSANTNFDQIKKSLKQQNRLFQEVKDTSLAALDARLMQTTTETALELARKMKIEGNTFDMDEFLLRMRNVLGLDRQELEDQSESEEDELDESMSDRGGRRRHGEARKGHLGDWEKVGWMAAKLQRRVPGLEFLYGPLKKETRQRIQNQRRRREVEPETRPQELPTQPRAGDAPPKEDTSELVKQVQEVLEKSDPRGEGINFFRLVIDPEDFGQSVENCFYLSFLIKEGKAGIDVTDEGEVMIYSKEGAAEMEVDGGEPMRHQAVIELDLATWEEAKQMFEIKQSTIPHREYTDVGPMAANTWYT